MVAFVYLISCKICYTIFRLICTKKFSKWAIQRIILHLLYSPLLWWFEESLIHIIASALIIHNDFLLKNIVEGQKQTNFFIELKKKLYNETQINVALSHSPFNFQPRKLKYTTKSKISISQKTMSLLNIYFG